MCFKHAALGTWHNCLCGTLTFQPRLLNKFIHMGLLNNPQVFLIDCLIHYLQESVGLTSHWFGYTLKVCFTHLQPASLGRIHKL